MIVYAKNFKNELKFLFDSGAQISLVKLSKLGSKVPITSSDSCFLNGIASSNVLTPTLGSCMLRMEVENVLITHKFQVVNDDFLHLSQDAILGNDFLQSNKIIIDFGSQIISLSDGKQFDKLKLARTLIDTQLFSIFEPILAKILNENNVCVDNECQNCECFGCALWSSMHDRSKLFENEFYVKLLDELEVIDNLSQFGTCFASKNILDELLKMNCTRFANFFKFVASQLIGSIHSQTRCNQCHNVDEEFYEFAKVYISPLLNVQAAIDHFFARQLNATSNFHCEHCSRKYASYVQIFVKSPPRFLHLSVLRSRIFQESEINIKKFEIKEMIYMKTNINNMNDAQETMKYNLLTVTIYKGSDLDKTYDFEYDNNIIHKAEDLMERNTTSEEISCELLYELADASRYDTYKKVESVSHMIDESYDQQETVKKHNIRVATTVPHTSDVLLDVAVTPISIDRVKMKRKVNELNANMEGTLVEVANVLFTALLLKLTEDLIVSQPVIVTKECKCIRCILSAATMKYLLTDKFPVLTDFYEWICSTVYNVDKLSARAKVLAIVDSIFNVDDNQLCVNDFDMIQFAMKGSIQHRRTCGHCFSYKITEEVTSYLTLPPGRSTIFMLQKFFEERDIETTCAKCLHNKARSSRINFVNLPEILCIAIDKSGQGNKSRLILINSVLPIADFVESQGQHLDVAYELMSFIGYDKNDRGRQIPYAINVKRNFYEKIVNGKVQRRFETEPECASASFLFYKLGKREVKQIATIDTVESNDQSQLTRFNTIMEEVKIGSTDPKVVSIVNRLVWENTDIFHVKGDKLTACDILEHTIPLFTDSAPVNIRPYSRRSQFEKDEIEKKVQDLLEQGIIEPCRSAFNSPLHLVKKGFDKDGKRKLRLTVDFRALNLLTIPEIYPCVQVLDILDQLKLSKYYSSVDLSSGYLQIKLSDSCKDKTAFTSGYNTYRFLRMPLGLRSSSHSFNRALRIALKDLIGKILYIFLDDILVYSESIPQHLERLSLVFQTLRQHNLKISPGKCNLLMTEIPFLGYIISEQGVQPDSKKTDAIQKFPIPKNAKAIKSFMGMVNYYSRHIPQLAEHAKPLHNLLKKEVKFTWSEECQKEFEYFKRCLMSPPILQFPDFNETFYLMTDASAVALSAILLQKKNEEFLPIAYASRTLSGPETRYPAAQTEVAAIVWGISHFKTYLGYRFFEIFSDCQALKWLLQVKSPNSRLLRWKLELQGYDFKINHIKGKDNVVADCLSRYIQHDTIHDIHVVTRAKAKEIQMGNEYKTSDRIMDDIQEDKEEIIEVNKLPVVMETSDNKLISDFPTKFYIVNSGNNKVLATKGIKAVTAEIGTIIHKEDNNEFILLTEGRFLDPRKLSELLLDFKRILLDKKVTKLSFDRNLFEGTLREYNMIKEGIEANFQLSGINFLFLKDKIVLLTDDKDKQQILTDFHDSPLGGHQGIHRMANKIGQQYKWLGMRKDVQDYVRKCKICQTAKTGGLHKQPMQITSNSRTQFSKIHVDSVGPLFESREGYKYIFTFEDELTRYFGAVPLIDHTADSVARALVEHVILRFGQPEIILSDSGVEFINALFAKITKLLSVRHHRTSPYHAQSNGLLERNHATLKAIIRSQTNNVVANWPEFVPFAVFVINSSINRSTNYTPHELVFGYKLALPTNLTKTPEPIYNYDDFYSELKFKLQTAHHRAREELLKSKLTNKKQYDKNSSISEYKVGDKVLLTNEQRLTKLHHPFIGPFEITEIISDVNVKIKKNGKDSIVHMNRIKKFFEHDIQDNNM